MYSDICTFRIQKYLDSILHFYDQKYKKNHNSIQYQRNPAAEYVIGKSRLSVYFFVAFFV